MCKVPKAWKKLGGYLHQDYMLDYPDFWSGIDQFSSDLSEPERQELIQFLRLFVENEQPEGTLKKIWQQTEAQIIITRVKPREFFQELFNRVTEQNT